MKTEFIVVTESARGSHHGTIAMCEVEEGNRPIELRNRANGMVRIEYRADPRRRYLRCKHVRQLKIARRIRSRLFAQRQKFARRAARRREQQTPGRDRYLWRVLPER